MGGFTSTVALVGGGSFGTKMGVGIPYIRKSTVFSTLNPSKINYVSNKKNRMTLSTQVQKPCPFMCRQLDMHILSFLEYYVRKSFSSGADRRFYFSFGLIFTEIDQPNLSEEAVPF